MMDDQIQQQIIDAQNFTTSLNRPAFFIGEEKKREEVSNEIKALSFIHQPPMQNIYTASSRPFVIAICDFDQLMSIKTIIRIMKRFSGIDAIKILYVANATPIDLEHLIFSQQIGCQQICYGSERSMQLRAFLKSIAFSKIDQQAFERINRQIIQAIARKEFDRLKKMSTVLVEIAKTEIHGLKLLTKINLSLKEETKAIFYLRQILKIDRQNIWAASSLARIFLESNQIKKGIEILDSETDFIPTRNRLKEPSDGLLGLLSGEAISSDMLSFLNLRAVMAIRIEALEEGISFYKMAIAGSQAEPSVQSKLYFNLGIACMKISDFASAVSYLEKSLKLGNEEDYIKAKQPLEKAQKALLLQKEKIKSPSSTPISPKEIKQAPSTEKSDDEVDLTD